MTTVLVHNRMLWLGADINKGGEMKVNYDLHV
jgi:hypothetical protein